MKSQLSLSLSFHFKTWFYLNHYYSSGSINRDQYELLLMAIGHSVPFHQIDSYWTDMGLANGDMLPFELFFDWWTSDVGVQYIPPSAAGGSRVAASKK
jgi:hypothetical protein